MILVVLAALLQAEWDARTLFERSSAEGLRFADGAIEPDRGELFEDDGPAAGFSYKPQQEVATAGVRLRKQLVIPDPEARKAVLLLGSKDRWDVHINGRPAALEEAGGAGRDWKGWAFDPALLRPGLNEIVLRGPGKIWIARDDEYAAGSLTRTRHPNRSAKSVDEGRTWDDARLGKNGDVDGEYAVRIRLDRPRSRGRLLLPVIDIGNLDGRPWGRPLKSVGRVLVRVEPEEAAVVQTRLSGRYVRIELEVTGRLRGIRIEAAPELADDWTSTLKAVEVRNPAVVRTSIPFAYEPFDHPALKELRERHGLDGIVKGAKGDLERAARLAAWTSGRWSKMHLKEAYPAWDARAILAPHADGTPVGGFCQQYNLVLLQACESLGLVGRAVSIGPGSMELKGGGHEVVEIWSNEHAKWVYIDGQAAWYFVDAEDGTPLSLLELRERQLGALRSSPHRPARVVKLAETKHAWAGLSGWPYFVELRLIPRSNFLQQPHPVPLNQGMRGWSWSGHYVWDDAEAPASLIYARRIHRRGDWEWTLNGAHVLLEPAAPDEFLVHLNTETPGFETFVASIDGAEPRPVRSGFRWTLHAGTNRLHVRSRNLAGREGPPSVHVIVR